MSKKELMKLADSFQKKADTAFQNYQETGASRYDSAFRRNEDIAAALRAAAEAAEEHNAYINLKMEMSNFASRARRVMLYTTEEEKAELTEALIRDIVSVGQLYGLISKN